MKRQRTLLLWTLVASLLAFVGCVGGRGRIPMVPTRSIDVTDKPKWWGALHRGQLLEVKDDVLVSSRRMTKAAYKITNDYDSTMEFGSNISVEMFKANPGKYWSDLFLLPKGTKLRCVQLVRYFSFSFNHYKLGAEILDGEHKGELIYVEPIGGDPDEKGSLHLWEWGYVRPVE